MKKNYNTTDLDPMKTFEKHVFHRDQFAHFLRWSHVLKQIKIGDTVVDFGAGKHYLLEVLYRNRRKPTKYIGLEYRGKEVEKAKELYKNLEYAEFYQQDIINPTMDYTQFQADHVVSFEVAEHVGSQNVVKPPYAFLKNFMSCGGPNARYYLSTPNYDPVVGAAGNHTYDSGDGLGVRVQELDHFDLQAAIEASGFEIVHKFGTFASQKDYKDHLNQWQKEMFAAISEYYDANLVSNLMAPVIDASKARNCLWVLKRKQTD